MNEALDPSAVLIAVAVVAVLGSFFGYVAYRFWRSGRRISDLLDTGAQRRRAQLESEARHGAPPPWKQALRRLVQILLVLAALGLAWLRLKSS